MKKNLIFKQSRLVFPILRDATSGAFADWTTDGGFWDDYSFCFLHLSENPGWEPPRHRVTTLTLHRDRFSPPAHLECCVFPTLLGDHNLNRCKPNFNFFFLLWNNSIVFIPFESKSPCFSINLLHYKGSPASLYFSFHPELYPWPALQDTLGHNQPPQLWPYPKKRRFFFLSNFSMEWSTVHPCQTWTAIHQSSFTNFYLAGIVNTKRRCPIGHK